MNQIDFLPCVLAVDGLQGLLHVFRVEDGPEENLQLAIETLHACLFRKGRLEIRGVHLGFKGFRLVFFG
jgi:hypothetical protein